MRKEGLKDRMVEDIGEVEDRGRKEKEEKEKEKTEPPEADQREKEELELPAKMELKESLAGQGDSEG